MKIAHIFLFLMDVQECNCAHILPLMPGTSIFMRKKMLEEKILILDNESYVQWTLKIFLEREGYLVVVANTIEKVLNHFAEDKISSLITEYQIDQDFTPGLIRDLKRRFPEVYVMMLTSLELKESEYEEIFQAGVDDLFQKPFSNEKVLLHLKKGLKQRETLLQKNQLELEIDRCKQKLSSSGLYRKLRRTVELAAFRF
jgi:DNA-binding NtrC family response regulator